MTTLSPVPESLEKLLADQRTWVVGRNGETWGQLSDAFDLVKHPENWKRSVSNALVMCDSEADARAKVELLEQAVPYFTGGPATIVTRQAWTGQWALRVSFLGYYHHVGA